MLRRSGVVVRTAAGKTRKEIIRQLMRYIAREAYRQLIRPGFLTTAAPLRFIALKARREAVSTACHFMSNRGGGALRVRSAC